MRVLKRLVPGIARVESQIPAYAESWQVWNTAALQRQGTLWIALGDSMSQGIGAQVFTGGWVGQLNDKLDAAGTPMRLVNLSVTGARIHDVVEDQIPRMSALGVQPELITVLVGPNDMIGRRRRARAVSDYARLLNALPPNTVVATLPRRNAESLAINALIDQAARAGQVRVADMRRLIRLRSLLGTRAEDFFHPNERGYATITGAFAAALNLPAIRSALPRHGNAVFRCPPPFT